MYRYVVNVRDKGRCHRVPRDAMALPRQKRRSVCGWRFGSAVSIAFIKTSKWGPLCRRCFPETDIEIQACSESPIETIEQYE